jgi:hypothetical protein
MAYVVADDAPTAWFASFVQNKGRWDLCNCSGLGREIIRLRFYWCRKTARDFTVSYTSNQTPNAFEQFTAAVVRIHSHELARTSNAKIW